MAIESYQQRRAQELGFPPGMGKRYSESGIKSFIATPFPPESYRTAPLTTEQQVALTNIAKDDFNQAISLVKEPVSPFTLANISIAQAKSGLEPVVQVSELLNVADKWSQNPHNQLNAPRLQVKATQLMMATGDVLGALAAAKHIYNDVANYSDLIKTAQESNLKAGSVKALRHGYLSGKSAAESALELAISHFGDLRYNTDQGIAGFVLKQRLALALPVEEALVDEWAKNYGKSTTDNWRKLDIAAMYAKAGFPDRAETVLNKTTEEPGQPKRAKVLSEMSIAWAKQGHDPLYAIDATMTMLDRFRDTKGNKQHFHKGEIIANLAVAEHMAGGDGEHYLKQAKIEAEKDPTNLRSDVLLYIADVEYKRLGMNPADTLKQSLDWADEFFAPDDGKRENYYGIDTMTYQHISKGFAKARLFTGARIALTPMDLYRENGALDEMAIDDKIFGLTFLAEMEARTALSS